MGSKPAHVSRPRPAASGRKPSRHKPISTRMSRTAAAAMLSEVRQRLELVMAIAYIASAALKSPHADSDAGVALALQRCIGDEIGRQLEDIGWVTRRLTDKPAATPRVS
jgi:hypothetical protein